MTLIELILVMALLTVLIGIAMPTLTRFFRGRRTQEEARRLLALTRYARSEAMARATPMEVWIDPARRAYGLRPRLEADQDRPPLQYPLADGLDLEVDHKQLDGRGQARIEFLSDGTLDEESLASVGIQSGNGGDTEAITLERTESGLGYEIQ